MLCNLSLRVAQAVLQQTPGLFGGKVLGVSANRVGRLSGQSLRSQLLLRLCQNHRIAIWIAYLRKQRKIPGDNLLHFQTSYRYATAEIGSLMSLTPVCICRKRSNNLKRSRVPKRLPV